MITPGMPGMWRRLVSKDERRVTAGSRRPDIPLQYGQQTQPKCRRDGVTKYCAAAAAAITATAAACFAGGLQAAVGSTERSTLPVRRS